MPPPRRPSPRCPSPRRPSPRPPRSATAGLLLLWLLPGCSITDYTSGQALSRTAVQNLHVGTTVQADVLAELGPPDDVAQLMFGSIWVYRLVEGSANMLEISVYSGTVGYEKSGSRYTSLAVIFDRKGVLSAMGLATPGGD